MCLQLEQHSRLPKKFVRRSIASELKMGKLRSLTPSHYAGSQNDIMRILLKILMILLIHSVICTLGMPMRHLALLIVAILKLQVAWQVKHACYQRTGSIPIRATLSRMRQAVVVVGFLAAPHLHFLSCMVGEIHHLIVSKCFVMAGKPAAVH